MKTSSLLGVLILAVLVSLSEQASRNYGEACSRSERCDSRRGTVHCDLESMKCACKEPENMEYDHVSGECQSIAGASCFTKPLRNRNVKNCIQGTTCVPISSNSMFGTCVIIEEEVIDNDLFDEIIPLVSESPEPTESTSNPDETTVDSEGSSNGPDPDESTTIESGDSTTDDGDNQSDSTTQRATTTTLLPGTTLPPPVDAGSACTDDNQCLDNASCNSTEVENERKCQCNEGYLSQFGGKKCARMVQGSCDKDEECISNGECGSEGKCVCLTDYKEKDGYCQATKVDQNCQSNDECSVKDSECKIEQEDNVYGNGTCTCVDNLEPKDNNTRCSATANIINFTVFLLLVSSTFFVNKWNH